MFVSSKTLAKEEKFPIRTIRELNTVTRKVKGTVHPITGHEGPESGS
jgi:hypothetical protein